MKTMICDWRSVDKKRRALVMLGFFFVATLILCTSTNPLAQNGYNSEMNGRARSVETRRVFVRSKALLVRAAVVEEKLLKRPEFNQLGLALTRDESNADIILELRHDVLTKYVYSAVDARTQTVLAGGKVSSLGGTVAGKVAKRFLKAVGAGQALAEYSSFFFGRPSVDEDSGGSTGVDSLRNLGRDPRVIFQQGDVRAQRCPFTSLGHPREEKRSKVATTNVLRLRFRERIIQYLLQNRIVNLGF